MQRYRDRLSGPLLDRFDLLVEVSRPGNALLDTAPTPAEESSATMRQRVCAARERQRVCAARERQLARQGMPNAELREAALERAVPLDAADRALLQCAVQRWGLSARACHRVLRVARSIADLEGSTDVGAAHLAEALGYRLGNEVFAP